MTVIHGYSHAPDDLDFWPNTLLIENGEGVMPDKSTGMPVVRVDTNYKPDRTGTHPVDLTIVDALRAAKTLIAHAQNSMESFSADDQLAASHGDDKLFAMLVELADVDSAIWELRTWLHTEIEDQREYRQEQVAARNKAAEQPVDDTPKDGR